jgi:hypothetical protein
MSASKSRRSHFLVSVLRIDHTALRGVRWSEVAREHAAGITLRGTISSSLAIDLPLFAENRNPQDLSQSAARTADDDSGILLLFGVS